MLNRYELEHLDDLMIQSQELLEYRSIHTLLPVSVQKALDKYEKEIKVEINRMIKAQNSDSTFLQMQKYGPYSERSYV